LLQPVHLVHLMQYKQSVQLVQLMQLMHLMQLIKLLRAFSAASLLPKKAIEHLLPLSSLIQIVGNSLKMVIKLLV